MRHSTITLNLAATLTALVFIAAHQLIPSLTPVMEPWVLAFSIVLVGIPHGALDHLISARLFEQGTRWMDHAAFYGWYLLLMGILSGLWFFTPDAGMLLFLLISVVHFGQADIEGFVHRDAKLHLDEEATAAPVPGPLSGWLRWGASLSRGFLIIGLIVSAHPASSLPIMAEALSADSPLLRLISDYIASILWAALGIHSLMVGLVWFLSDLRTETRIAYLLDSVLVAAMFLLLPPLLSFSIYFALWHSLGHIQEIRTYFDESGKPLTLIGFYLQALPFTLVSFAGLAVLLWVTRSFGLENQVVSLTFVLISVLTLPHMVVAHRMLRRR